jgi:tetratricopeptide (TPR) repeat protein
VALTSELDSLKRLNSFQVLGLAYDASDLDVRTAFGELTKKYHPDRYARFQSADLRNLAAEIFILIRDAYRKLFDQPGRAAVIAVATGTKPKVMVPPLAPAAPAADPRVMAESMLDNGKYDEALAFYKVLLKKNPADRIAKAGVELAEGMRALSARDRLEAAQRFETVLELDPANERAARELADMRRVATNERKGMLSRLLGKKE